ncbi:MAG: molybdenum cofactor guanylyltransferase MobA, partial [Pseudomonadota bacterium]
RNGAGRGAVAFGTAAFYSAAMTDISSIAGLVLAGGLSRRMGGADKALIEIGGVPLVTRAVRRLAPQVAEVILNANGDPVRFASLGLPVVADVVAGHAGPLAGVLTGLEWLAANRPAIGWMATVPTDSPLFPHNLVARLAEAGAPLAVACSQGRIHPVFALWRLDLLDRVRALVASGERRMGMAAEMLGAARVEWPNDPFVNVNTPGDLAALDAAMLES